MNAPKIHSSVQNTSPNIQNGGVKNVSIQEQIRLIIEKTHFVLEEEKFGEKEVKFNFSQLNSQINISTLMKYLLFQYTTQGFFIEGLNQSEIQTSSGREKLLESLFTKKLFLQDFGINQDEISWNLKKIQYDFMPSKIIENDGNFSLQMNFIRESQPPTTPLGIDEVIGYLISGNATGKRRVVFGFDLYVIKTLVEFLNHQISKKEFENMLTEDTKLSNIKFSGNRISAIVASDRVSQENSGCELDFVMPKNAQNMKKFISNPNIKYALTVQSGDFLGYLSKRVEGALGVDIFGKTKESQGVKFELSNFVGNDFTVDEQDTAYKIFAKKSGVVTVENIDEIPKFSLTEVFIPNIPKALERADFQYDKVRIEQDLDGKSMKFIGKTFECSGVISASQIFIPHGNHTNILIHQTIQNTLIVHLGTGKIHIGNILPNCIIYAPNCMVQSNSAQHNAQIICEKFVTLKSQGVRLVYAKSIQSKSVVHLDVGGIFVGENIGVSELKLQGNADIILVRENRQTQEFVDEIQGKISVIEVEIKKNQLSAKKVQEDLNQIEEYNHYKKLFAMRQLFLTPQANLTQEQAKIFTELCKKFTLVKIEALMSQKKFIIQNSLDNLADYKTKIQTLQSDKKSLEDMLLQHPSSISIENIEQLKGSTSRVMCKQIDTHFFAENENLSQSQVLDICEKIYQYFLGKSIPPDISQTSGSVLQKYS